MKKTIHYILLPLVFLFIAILSSAQTQTFTGAEKLPPPPPVVKPLTRILFIFDCSYSMYGNWGKESKIDIAKKLLIKLVDSLEKVPDVQMALRLYGHQSPVPPQDCGDTKLEVPFGDGNAGNIRQKLRWAEPKGTTPIAKSLEAANKDFPYNEKARNIIILITDGMEECNGDPCAVSASLQKKGILLKPFIIGVGLDSNITKSFNCVGRVFNAKEEKQLKEVLTVVVSQAINSTTAQVNLLDSHNKPVETDVTLTFYDQVSGLMKYNFLHTINFKGNPDTLIIDPLLTYKLVVQTIPPVVKENLELVHGKHTIFTLSTPQGSLVVKRPGGSNNSEIQYVVRKAGEVPTLNVQKLDKVEKYLCGKYDIEILTLPRIMMKDIVISQSQTTTLQIPQPGVVALVKNAPGSGGIFVQNGNQWDFVVNIENTNSGSESFKLQPGNYYVTYRPVNARDVRYSVVKKFTIKSGGTEQIKLN